METSPPKGHRLSGTIRWEEVGSLCEEVGLALSSERRSTQRSQAQLSPRQTALAGPVHSQNGGSDRFELLWVSPPGKSILSIYQVTAHTWLTLGFSSACVTAEGSPTAFNVHIEC